MITTTASTRRRIVAAPLHSSQGQFWTFEANGQHRTLDYWTHPFLVLAWDATQDEGVPFVLISGDTDTENLWVEPGFDVEFHIPECDPRFPYSVTEHHREKFGEFGGYRHRQGYGVVHISGQDVTFEDEGHTRPHL
ncbi:hypothetical protein SEA_GEAZY_46 [Gordonia phage GEazy]|nr:hypothetical protein SEA_GEAZY_46 [Gordonia phage GEazy]